MSTDITMKPKDITIEQIREKLDASEYVVACNPAISPELKQIIKEHLMPDISNYDSKLYYTYWIEEQLVNSPEECGFEHVELSEEMIDEVVMLEKAYDILMFID